MGLPRSRVPQLVLIFGLSGAVFGMLMQWWVSAVASPLIVSGKPLFSWPAFVPIMFECAILGGAVGAVVGFLVSSRLPQHYHELFRVKRFDSVTDDSFFLSVESKDVLFGPETEHLLANLGARNVEPIPG